MPFSISRFMLILNSFSVGSWRIDSAPVSSLEHVERALEAELGVGRGRDREPEVELVGAQVVVRDAGVGVDDLRRPVRVVRVDLRRDQHRLVAERAGVEDRRDLADDPLVEQAPGARHQLVDLEAVRRRRAPRRARRRAGSSTAAGSSAACRSRRAGSRRRPCARGPWAAARVRSGQPSRRLLGEVGEDHVGAGAADRGQRLERRGALVEPAVGAAALIIEYSPETW